MAEAPTYSLAQVIALAKGTMNWYEYAKSTAQHGKNNQDDISTLQSAAFSGATPGWQAAIDLRWYVADTSSSTTTYTGVTKPTATGSDSLFAGYFIIFKPANNNTGASTLNVASSDAAVDIKKITSGAKAALAAGDLDSDTYAELIFDGTDWIMLNAPVTTDLVADTSPQLGGDLDLNSNDITGTGGIPAGNLTGTFANTIMPAGSVIQVVSATVTAADSTTSTSFVASSLTASITPADATNKVLVLITSLGRVSDTGSLYYTLYEGATNLGHSSKGMGKISHDGGHRLDIPISLTHLAAPGSASAVTYTLYYLVSSGITGEIGVSADLVQNITLLEIAV